MFLFRTLVLPFFSFVHSVHLHQPHILCHVVRIVLTWHVWISHQCMIARSMLKVESSNFLMMIYRYTSTGDDAPRFILWHGYLSLSLYYKIIMMLCKFMVTQCAYRDYTLWLQTVLILPVIGSANSLCHFSGQCLFRWAWNLYFLFSQY